MLSDTGSLDDAIDKNRQRMTRQDQAENAAAAERAAGARQAEDLIREAAEKFASLAALQLILGRPRKLFDRGKAIVSSIGEKPGTYTAVVAMRCWAVSSKLRYSHAVLTERGQLAQVDHVDRITINTESARQLCRSMSRRGSWKLHWCAIPKHSHARIRWVLAQRLGLRLRAMDVLSPRSIRQTSET